MRFHCFGWCLFAALAGCAAPELSAPTPSPTIQEFAARPVRQPWQIEFVQSGGIAGVMRSLSLFSAGQLEAWDRKVNKRVTAQLPEKEVAEIESLLAGAQSYRPTGRPPQCADCFQYDLTAQWRGERFDIRLNDRNLPGSSVEPLFNALVKLQERALAGQLKP